MHKYLLIGMLFAPPDERERVERDVQSKVNRINFQLKKIRSFPTDMKIAISEDGDLWLDQRGLLFNPRLK